MHGCDLLCQYDSSQAGVPAAASAANDAATDAPLTGGRHALPHRYFDDKKELV